MVSSSWLTKQRKQNLIDLAAQAGLELCANASLSSREVIMLTQCQS